MRDLRQVNEELKIINVRLEQLECLIKDSIDEQINEPEETKPEEPEVKPKPEE